MRDSKILVLLRPPVLVHGAVLCVTFHLYVTRPKLLEKIQISRTIWLRVNKFDMEVNINDLGLSRSSVKVIGQRSISQCQKCVFFSGLCIVYLKCGLDIRGHKGQDQRSLGSMSKMKVVGHRSRSPCEKMFFQGLCIVYLTRYLHGKGHVGQGQRSYGSKVK